MGLPNIGPLELIIILAIALLVVGPGRLPEMGNAIGRTIREFRNASSDMVDATKVETEPKPATPPSAPATQPAPPAPPAAAAEAAVTAEPAPAPAAAATTNTLSDEATPNTLAATPETAADTASQATTDGKDDA
jgi:TatA/E family protein of Tat protein translocase